MTSITSDQTVVEPLSIDLAGVIRRTGLGRSLILDATYKKQLPSLKVGQRRLWRLDDVRAWLAKFEEGGNPDPTPDKATSEVEKADPPVADVANVAPSEIPTAQQYNLPVESLHLTTRILNCLKRASIHRVGEILEKSEGDLLRIRNFGEGALEELDRRLTAIDIHHPEFGGVGYEGYSLHRSLKKGIMYVGGPRLDIVDPPEAEGATDNQESESVVEVKGPLFDDPGSTKDGMALLEKRIDALERKTKALAASSKEPVEVRLDYLTVSQLGELEERVKRLEASTTQRLHTAQEEIYEQIALLTVLYDRVAPLLEVKKRRWFSFWQSNKGVE